MVSGGNVWAPGVLLWGCGYTPGSAANGAEAEKPEVKKPAAAETPRPSKTKDSYTKENKPSMAIAIDYPPRHVSWRGRW